MVLKDNFMEEIKKVLDMGFEIHSPKYRLNTINWVRIILNDIKKGW